MARAPSIMFVTPESAVTAKFGDYINRLQLRGELDRVVVEECSYGIRHRDGRVQTQNARVGAVIDSWGVQRVFLTATLSPQDEAEFFQTMQIDSSRMRMFRQATTRPNIRYRVRHAEEKNVHDRRSRRSPEGIRTAQQRQGHHIRRHSQQHHDIGTC